MRSRFGLPEPGSEKYEQATRAFYHGLASLEVGLVEDAKREFTTVTTTVPEEPAAWANLGLAHLRLGQLDEAAVPIDTALKLAPDNADIALLAGRMEIGRGRLDEGLVHLRRAVELAPEGLQPLYALAEEVENAAPPAADAQALETALTSMDALTKLAPQNVAVLVERARIAAKVQDRQRLNDSIERLKPMAAAWPAPAVELYQEVQRAVAAGDFPTTTTTSLRNVLRSVPAFLEDLSAIRTSAELIAEPIERFIALTPPPAQPAAPDTALSFSAEPIGPRVAPDTLLLTAVEKGDAGAPDLYETGADFALRPVEGGAPVATFPLLDGPRPTARSIVVADLNGDFQNDFALGGQSAVQIALRNADGTFGTQIVPMNCRDLSATDVEMDGDLDLVCAGSNRGSPTMLRNNGDGTWTSAPIFANVLLVGGLAWGDLDSDGDSDAVVVEGTEGRLQAFFNRQAGDYVGDILQQPRADFVAVTVADVDADGIFDIISLDSMGRVRRTWLDGNWRTVDIASWDGFNPRAADFRLLVADLDNNGALDLIAAGGFSSRIWLGNERYELVTLASVPNGEVVGVMDFNADGRLDLLARAATGSAEGPGAPSERPTAQAVRFINIGAGKYHWKQIRTRAQETAGDQRINSFGVGGYIEARAGLLFQKQLLTGGPVHFGLGTHTSIDVARIVWPNGIAQAEFGVKVDDGMVAEQRLKGSCPWVFTWDGTRMVFVTDFLWRSPLGLRINAQDTAGVTQTEDWVRLRGDQLVPRNGLYDVRITAELWETHFFDHVSLLAVDHPEGIEVFVDERFSPASPPAYKVHAVKDLRPVARALDERGADVTGTIIKADGQYLTTFARGRYQGIAEDHFVEVDLAGSRADVLIASGWIYPTDSSINVAIAQAGIVPRGLSLEARNPDGSWRVVNPNLGFPAGKNKTLVVDLSGIKGAQRIRLRTNLEIYWDALQLGSRADSPVRTTKIAASRVDLRYRGFSHTVSPRGSSPETPEYDRVDSTSPRWRDLAGYHTRFGDVGELVERVDDRYVIMNAGDELRLQFPEVPAPAQGWRRDFVLVGDGWEKDGDYNTGFSQTVLPLPSHDKPAYGSGTTSLVLEDDPVYRRHRDDWQRFHTRYVTPQRFLNALRPAKSK